MHFKRTVILDNIHYQYFESQLLTTLLSTASNSNTKHKRGI